VHPVQPIPINVTEVGEFIRFQSCERRFKLGLSNRQLARSVPFSERLFNTLDPVLQEVGHEAEGRWEGSLQAQGFNTLTPHPNIDEPVTSTPWSDFRQLLESVPLNALAYGREIEVAGRIGAFEVSGRIDFVVVLWDSGRVRLRLIEGKASRKDRTYHRIQLAIYMILLRRELQRTPLIIADQEVDADMLEGTVVRIDESTNEPQDMILQLALNLDTEVADVERMLSEEGLLATIAANDLDSIEYQLNSKCDGCVFSVHCLPESARLRRLELTGVPPRTCRVLRAQGISTIDELATINLESPLAASIRQAGGFDENIDRLIRIASARRSTLPRGQDDPDTYQVRALPHSGHGQLPTHEIGGQRLVRIYLQVDYDYVENRLGALSAHITSSDFRIYTPFDETTHVPLPGYAERRRTSPVGEPAVFEQRVGSGGREVVTYQTQAWTGSSDEDTASERQLIQQFFLDLMDSIAEVAQAERAPVHFYVYSRSEMTQLIEACTRTSSLLLSHLRELLGCRESLEQLIFSCLQDEVDRRFALGWTSRGLCVATSLSWFGQRYHWTRRVGGAAEELDRVFEQDIFDFRTRLDLDANGNWAASDAETASRHRFEIRSRFHDTLTAPYWRALWRTLPNPDDPRITDGRVKASIRRYNRVVVRPGLMRAYLVARVHALRWLEERIQFKNGEIEKTPLEITQLQNFTLNVDTTGRAAIDFLRLDHHVAMTDWLTARIQPMPVRVQTGQTMPVWGVEALNDKTLTAEIGVEDFGLTTGEFSLRTAFDSGGFVRLSPRDSDINRAQTIGQLTRGGITCKIDSIDWEGGTISLTPIFSKSETYLLSSWTPDPGEVFDFAAIDDSPSDYVAGRVERRLRSGLGRHVFQWFDPSNPQIPAQLPLPADRAGRIRACLATWQVPHTAARTPLTDDQRNAVTEGVARSPSEKSF
jgi:hypothetical protein